LVQSCHGPDVRQSVASFTTGRQADNQKAPKKHPVTIESSDLPDFLLVPLWRPA
jgi:hypothetical protein